MNAPDPTPAPLGPDFQEALQELLEATGGVGASWRHCALPFGVVALVAGVSSTAITFSVGGPSLDLAQSAALTTLGVGLGLLFAASLCWYIRRRRQEAAPEGQPEPAEP